MHLGNDTVKVIQNIKISWKNGIVMLTSNQGQDYAFGIGAVIDLRLAT